GTALCPADVTKDKAVGDQGINVEAANVAVTVTCSAVAYAQNDVLSLIAPRLQEKAAREAGPGYVLRGSISVQARVQQVNKDNSILLLVEAKGRWLYRFSDEQKKQLAQLITGKDAGQAEALLRAQSGIADVRIQSSVETLPTDPNQITVVVQDMPGGGARGFAP
ncbi:MAG: hypothetical protein IMW89_22145, partial [Ktedonobacteraceae bacterium]|nr:hypothetical protein [Ktedonobacteraceae bacterium]